MDNVRIKEYAIEHGYQNAKYLCDWNGYKCYEPIMSEEGMSYIGLPLLIMENSVGEIRMSTSQEAMQQMRDSRERG